MEVANITDPVVLTYFVASTMRLDTADRQALLEERDTAKRMRKLTLLLTKELEVVELGHKIQSDIQREMEKNQREFYLRQQLRAIQEELGEVDPQQAENNELRTKIDEAKMPEDVKKAADRELDRLSKVPQASPEYSVIRTYLDWLVTLPWNAETADHIDIKDSARAILDEDHYDLEKIKDRIIEYLAVGKLKKKLTGPILCFVGPPGVGKTSLGQSIARAMGRKFVRLSVGGVRDEAEIRGHRRTYIGAMPGTIVRAMRDAGTQQSRDDDRRDRQSRRRFSRRPAVGAARSARSRTERQLPRSLSRPAVRSVASALHLHGQQRSIRSRRRCAIAWRSSRSRATPSSRSCRSPNGISSRSNARHNGLRDSQAQIADPALRAIINDYTREAGVRNSRARDRDGLPQDRAQDRREPALQRRASSRRTSSNTSSRPRFFNEVRKRVASVGVATGMAWTPVGGDILFIETQVMPGTGKLVLTGQLGDVMKESAQAAVSFLRSRSSELGLPDDYFAKHDIHIHVPAGADSEGRTVGGHRAGDVDRFDADRHQSRSEPGDDRRDHADGASACRSAASKRRCSAQSAPASRRFSCPRRNEMDLDDIPKEVRDTMTFVAGRRALRSPPSRARQTRDLAGAARRFARE